MKRRTFITAVASCVFVVPLLAKGQTARTVYRLGILHPGTEPTTDPILADTFTKPLRELGYVEGQNFAIERRYVRAKFELLPVFARELAALRINAILAIGSSAIQAAKDATTTVPIVFLTGGDPVALGFVASLARPAGNITGVLITPEGSLAVKRLELLQASVPRATRIALLIAEDPAAGLQQQIEETRVAASSLGLQLDIVEVRGGDYAGAFSAIARRRPQALLVGAQSLLLRDRKYVIELAAKYRLPASYEWSSQVRDGGLMSYGASDVETYKQVASYIDRIFKGAKPGDLPIWQPHKLHLVINLKTAKALGLMIPHSVMLRADEVIE